jgi:2-iminobutanoate/2-iminopropanoate deaminase
MLGALMMLSFLGASAGVRGGGYLYVSAQGSALPTGANASTFEEHVQSALENVRAVIGANGLTMDHVVYTHVYLEDVEKLPAVDSIYRRYFPGAPPARAVLGVRKLPGGPIEIEAVAVEKLDGRKVIFTEGDHGGESRGILTQDRLFVSAMAGVGADPEAQVDSALDRIEAVLEAAGLSVRHLVFVNPYLTAKIPLEVMNERYARRFEFGNTPARATIWVESLPEGAAIAFTGVAVRDLGDRRAVRPRNMAPSPTASPCVFASDTLYCSAKSGFIPGPFAGIYAATVEHQIRQTMRNLLDGLEEAEMDFGDVVSARIYLDDLRDREAVERIFGEYLGEAAPALTTVQQVAPLERRPDERGRYPALEQISLVAIKR